MSDIPIRNVSDRVFELLNQAAAIHHNSINSELFQLIEKVKIGGQINPEQHLAAARQSRSITNRNGVKSAVGFSPLNSCKDGGQVCC